MAERFAGAKGIDHLIAAAQQIDRTLTHNIQKLGRLAATGEDGLASADELNLQLTGNLVNDLIGQAIKRG